MFIPYAKFPKGHIINSVKDNPELFKKVEFREFLLSLPPSKQAAFLNSELFLHTSLYQENSMTSLIMLLSAIERAVSPDHRPLEWHLASKDFKARIQAAKNGATAYTILEKEIAHHSNTHGSRRTIVSFYNDNLSNSQKLQLVRGIKLAHKYKKSTPPSNMLKSDRFGELVALFTPIPEPNPILKGDDTPAIDKELSKRVRAVIYEIRNGFVHHAQSNPFGNEDYMKKNTKYTYEKYGDGGPKETWLITMTFKQLHAITLIAFQNFWLKEYQKIKK